MTELRFTLHIVVECALADILHSAPSDRPSPVAFPLHPNKEISARRAP